MGGGGYMISVAVRGMLQMFVALWDGGPPENFDN